MPEWLKVYIKAFQSLGYNLDITRLESAALGKLLDPDVIKAKFFKWILTDDYYGMLRVAVGAYTDDNILAVVALLNRMIAKQPVSESEWRFALLAAAEVAWTDSEFNQPKSFCAYAVAYACCSVLARDAVLSNYPPEGVSQSTWDGVADDVAKDVRDAHIKSVLHHAASALSGAGTNLTGIYSEQYNALVGIVDAYG